MKRTYLPSSISLIESKLFQRMIVTFSILRLMPKVISEINVSIHTIYPYYENCYIHHSLPNLAACLQR